MMAAVTHLDQGYLLHLYWVSHTSTRIRYEYHAGSMPLSVQYTGSRSEYPGTVGHSTKFKLRVKYEYVYKYLEET